MSDAIVVALIGSATTTVGIALTYRQAVLGKRQATKANAAVNDVGAGEGTLKETVGAIEHRQVAMADVVNAIGDDVSELHRGMAQIVVAMDAHDRKLERHLAAHQIQSDEDEAARAGQIDRRNVDG